MTNLLYFGRPSDGKFRIFHGDFGIFHGDFGIFHGYFGIFHGDFGIFHGDFGKSISWRFWYLYDSHLVYCISNFVAILVLVMRPPCTEENIS
jgi:hypothetical protein